jgi:hypothetical protein
MWFLILEHWATVPALLTVSLVFAFLACAA